MAPKKDSSQGLLVAVIGLLGVVLAAVIANPKSISQFFGKPIASPVDQPAKAAVPVTQNPVTLQSAPEPVRPIQKPVPKPRPTPKPLVEPKSDPVQRPEPKSEPDPVHTNVVQIPAPPPAQLPALELKIINIKRNGLPGSTWWTFEVSVNGVRLPDIPCYDFHYQKTAHPSWPSQELRSPGPYKISVVGRQWRKESGVDGCHQRGSLIASGADQSIALGSFVTVPIQTGHAVLGGAIFELEFGLK